ncbi:MAG: hypothetical protein ACTSXE_02725 [Candidatus Thorarchaeota archaeon]
MARLSISISEDTEKKLETIPKGSRSQIVRTLVTAYVAYATEVGPAHALGAGLSGNLKLTTRQEPK